MIGNSAPSAFDQAVICASVREVQVAKLVALRDRKPDMLWSVTPGLDDECESNREARKPR